ncbi:MAG: hypothetical protein AB1469_04165 [Pseudomonadota bacterium]
MTEFHDMPRTQDCAKTLAACLRSDRRLLGERRLSNPSRISAGQSGAPVGGQIFKERLLEKAAGQDGLKTEVAMHSRSSIGRIVKVVAEVYKVMIPSITWPQQGIMQITSPGGYAMYTG